MLVVIRSARGGQVGRRWCLVVWKGTVLVLPRHGRCGLGDGGEFIRVGGGGGRFLAFGLLSCYLRVEVGIERC